jgi:hypothetical protein
MYDLRHITPQWNIVADDTDSAIFILFGVDFAKCK